MQTVLSVEYWKRWSIGGKKYCSPLQNIVTSYTPDNMSISENKLLLNLNRIILFLCPT